LSEQDLLVRRDLYTHDIAVLVVLGLAPILTVVLVVALRRRRWAGRARGLVIALAVALIGTMAFALLGIAESMIRNDRTREEASRGYVVSILKTPRGDAEVWSYYLPCPPWIEPGPDASHVAHTHAEERIARGLSNPSDAEASVTTTETPIPPFDALGIGLTEAARQAERQRRAWWDGRRWMLVRARVSDPHYDPFETKFFGIFAFLLNLLALGAIWACRKSWHAFRRCGRPAGVSIPHGGDAPPKSSAESPASRLSNRERCDTTGRPGRP